MDWKKIAVVLIGVLAILLLVFVAMDSTNRKNENYNRLLMNMTNYDYCTAISGDTATYRCCSEVTSQLEAMNISLNNRVYTCDILQITKNNNKIEVVKK